jgi:hypothetical protein
MENEDLKQFIVEVIDEYLCPHPPEIAQKWIGGSLIMKPSGDQQPKEVPFEVFFKKITGIREALRVLEQKINNHPSLSTEDRATFQGYITKSYGSLTTFNILFKNDRDRFHGAGKGHSGDQDDDSNMTLSAAKAKLNLNEY